MLTNSWEEVRLGSFTFFLNRCSNFHSGPRALLRRYISLRTRSLNFPHIDTITNDSAGSRSPEIFSSQHQLTPEKEKKNLARHEAHYTSEAVLLIVLKEGSREIQRDMTVIRVDG